jgi:hypothetical protein
MTRLGIVSSNRVSLVLCDDGSHQPGNDPESAMRRIGDVGWCTNAFVDHDVDLVADLTTPHLVMEFQASNGGSRFSAPVKEALAFASLMPPNLEAARVYDGEAGIQKAREMVAGDKNEGRSRSVPPGHPRAGFVFLASHKPAMLFALSPLYGPPWRDSYTSNY